MTAGQGDQHGQEQGQPQGGQPPAWPPAPPQQPPYGWTPPGAQPPPAQNPYGQPPPAQNPYGQPPPAQGAHGENPYGQNPYGQNPYGQSPYGQNPYAFPAAPTAGPQWQSGAPAPMERPVTVRAGVGAFLAALVLSAVGSIATFLGWDEMLDWATAEQGLGADDPALEGMDPEQVAELILQASIAFGVVLLLVQALVIWSAWRGRNWARIVLWVLGGLTLLSVPFNATASGPLPFVTALTWFQILLTLVGVVLLALKPSNDWYRFRKWQRATGQG